MTSLPGVPRYPLDAYNLPDEPSEYCWGPGLSAFEDAPPSEGGRYRGRASVEDNRSSWPPPAA